MGAIMETVLAALIIADLATAIAARNINPCKKRSHSFLLNMYV